MVVLYGQGGAVDKRAVDKREFPAVGIKMRSGAFGIDFHAKLLNCPRKCMHVPDCMPVSQCLIEIR